MASKPKSTNGTTVLKPVGEPRQSKISKFTYQIIALLISHPDGMVQSGRSGSVVHQKNGIRRNFTAPSLATTTATGRARGLFGSFSTSFTLLAQAVQMAWNAGSWTTTNRLNRVINLSGKSAFARFNINLSNSGQALLTSPPAAPTVASPLLAGVITADDSAHSIELAYTPNTDAGEVLVFATTPLLASTFKPASGQFKLLGHFDGTAASPLTFTLLYNSVFGANAVSGVGKKIFVDVVTIAANGNASTKVRYVGIIVA